jgi:hypothetical protein
MAQVPFQNVFPFNPAYSSWDNFNGNLVMYYGQEPIPYHDEANWQITAKNIAQLPTFSNYIVPDPGIFNNWQDWASEFVLIVNGPPHK